MRAEAKAPAADRPVAGGRLTPTSRLLAVLVSLGVGLAGCAWLAGIWHSAWLWPGQSDSAAVILAGDSMRHGNWLLKGWFLPYDTYWLLDIPLYAVGVAVLGMRPAVMHAVPLLFYLAVVATGIWMAVKGSGRPTRLAAGAITFVLLGLLGPTAAVTLLHGPAHVSSALACLLAFVCLTWPTARRGSFAGPGLAFLVLTMALVSDPMARIIGLAPLVAAAAIGALRDRAWRPYVAPAVVPVAALVVAHFVKLGATALGGFLVVGGQPGLTPPAGWVGKLPLFWNSTLAIFGVQSAGGSLLATAAGVVHLSGLILVVAATVFALVRAVRRPQPDQRGTTGGLLDSTLALGVAAGVAAFFVSGYASDPTSIRYLSPAFIFGAILAGRAVAAGAHRIEWRSSPLRQAVVALAGVLTAAYAITFAIVAVQPSPVNPAVGLASWLESQGLTRGYGAYWDSSIVTLFAEDRVQVRPVDEGTRGMEPYRWNSSRDWYAVNTGQPAIFLVFEPSAPWKGVDISSATASFGPPVATYVVGRYQVLRWDHDLTPLLQSR